ncbi:MAG: portal protein [Arsenophonus sp. NC-PE1-MAG3]
MSSKIIKLLTSSRYNITVGIGPTYIAIGDTTVSVLIDLLRSMITTKTYAKILKNIILDNMSSEGLNEFNKKL